MGLFRKKEAKAEAEELPELPRLPDFPRLPELPEIQKIKPYEREVKSFPSFPSSQIGEDISQEAVKSAVSDWEPNERKPVQATKAPLAREKRTLEISEQSPSPEMQGDLQPSILDTKLPPPPAPQFSRFQNKTEPVYIRIDKFKTAVAHFQEIQAKIYEIENLLRKIKEAKQREDAELRDWEKELEIIKARIDSIDKNIFSRLE